MTMTVSDSWQLGSYVLGTAGLGGVWGSTDPESSVRTILIALESGISYIDTAPAYGDGEAFLGEALRRWKGAPPLISTKVGRLKSFASDQGIYDYTPGSMVVSVENSLVQLGCSVLDVLFLHEPAAIPLHQVEAAVNEMQAFKKRGYARKIGLGGNYPPSFSKYLSDGVFDVVMEYNRLNACCTDALTSTLPECQNTNTEYWAASPLYMGLLGRRFQEFTETCPNWLNQQAVDAALKLQKIAEENQLSLTSLGFRFLQNIPFPIKIVLGPSNQQELEKTLNAIMQGPLPSNLYQSVLKRINEAKNNKI